MNKRLLSKIQHKNFEPGEYIEIQQRTYAEVIEEIERFPWQKERENIVISLTNPSVTIEDGSGNYLKFEVFFNQKYVLHYFNTEHVLYTKSFVEAKDAYSYIENFYEQNNFNLSEFKKENTWMQYNLIHFQTKHFHYTLTKERVRKYFWFTNWTTVLFVPFFLILSLSLAFKEMYVAAIFLFLISSIYWLPTLIYFFRYKNYAKDRMLYITKGSDVFEYGIIDYMATYNKNEVESLILHEVKNSRSPLSEFSYLELNFKDGSSAYIPNSLIERGELLNKFPSPQFKVQHKGGVPTIPK